MLPLTLLLSGYIPPAQGAMTLLLVLALAVLLTGAGLLIWAVRLLFDKQIIIRVRGLVLLLVTVAGIVSGLQAVGQLL